MKKTKGHKQGEKSLKRINKIKLKGTEQTWEDRQFLKTIQYAKGSNAKYAKLVKEKSGECITYIDKSLIKEVRR